MKTPNAILIGLSLIAAAIDFKDRAVKSAHAFGNPTTKDDVLEVIKDCLYGAKISDNRLYTTITCL